jgi:hyperosmotically inducible protein
MKSTPQRFLALSLGLAALAVTALARGPQAPLTLDQQVRHELLMLPYIGVFDNLNYSVDANGVVTLSGEVVRPVDRYNAEQAVKSLAGVAQVDNQIEVLPLSPFDDRIRLATFRALARATPLDRYFWGVHPAIRIIVKNGNVTLEGTVLNEGDRTYAFLAANSVPEVFSVTNNLQTEK